MRRCTIWHLVPVAARCTRARSATHRYRKCNGTWPQRNRKLDHTTIANWITSVTSSNEEGQQKACCARFEAERHSNTAVTLQEMMRQRATSNLIHHLLREALVVSLQG